MPTTDLPGTATLDAEVRREIVSAAIALRLPAGTKAFGHGDDCHAYVFVDDGVVRVQMVTESGREILLYRVVPGECCILTVSHLLRGESYAAEGICETDVRARALPAPVFHRLMGSSEGFRTMVLADYARRVGDILTMVDATASRPVPARLARAVLERTAATGETDITHHELAIDLGTAREVVSRVLKDWERAGLVALARGRLAVVERGKLARIRDL